MISYQHTITQACSAIREHFTGNIDCAVILGSGLSSTLNDHYEEVARIPYNDLPGLPKTTAPSHKGELVIVKSANKTVALCAGRHHLYEGYSPQQICTMVYVIRALGAQTLIITNAAGALNTDYQPGDIMLINDHINFTGRNPLIGMDDSLGARFPDMSQAYSRELAARANEVAKSVAGLRLHSGVYAGVTGPSLETSAERRMFQQAGADAVGMSTVMEVIAANHCGLDVLGLSAITNLALGDKNQAPDTIEKVLENAAIAGKKIEMILSGLL